MENETPNKKLSMEIDKTFYDMIFEYQNEYEKKYHIKPTAKEITKILTERILKAGGFLV